MTAARAMALLALAGLPGPSPAFRTGLGRPRRLAAQVMDMSSPRRRGGEYSPDVAEGQADWDDGGMSSPRRRGDEYYPEPAEGQADWDEGGYEYYEQPAQEGPAGGDSRYDDYEEDYYDLEEDDEARPYYGADDRDIQYGSAQAFRRGDARDTGFDKFLKSVYDSLFFSGLELEEDTYRGMDFSEVMENLQIDILERRRARKAGAAKKGGGARRPPPGPQKKRTILERMFDFGGGLDNEVVDVDYEDAYGYVEPQGRYYDDEPVRRPSPPTASPSRERKRRSGTRYHKDDQVFEVEEQPEDWDVRWSGAPAPAARSSEPSPPPPPAPQASQPPAPKVTDAAALVRVGLKRQLDAVMGELESKAAALDLLRQREAAGDEGDADRAAALTKAIGYLEVEKRELEAELAGLEAEAA